MGKDIEELKHREWWTPQECSDVLGRAAQFWRDAYWNKKVSGYTTGNPEKRHIRIRAESARAYLESLCEKE